MSEETPSAELGQFFDSIWGQETGFVYLPVRDPNNPDQTKNWRRVFFEWPTHKTAIVRHCFVNSAEGKDVYYSPAIFNTPKNATKENVKGTQVLWVDFDGSAPDDWSSETLKATVPAPSLRIQSSTDDHQHVYWRLKEFTSDISFVEEKNRALAYELDADTSGWDIGQVLRPPFTINTKHDLPVTVIEESERQFTYTDFAHFKQVKQLVQESLDDADIPPIQDVLLKYPFDDNHRELFQKKEIPQGERSTALMRLGFFGAESGMSDAEIYSLLIYADDRWGKFKNRSDRKRRLTDIINKARQKHPSGLAIPEGLLRSIAGDESGVEQAPRYVYGWQSLLNSEFHIEWAIDKLIEITGISMVTSAPGIGKTQLAMQLGVHCALGKDFLGWKITRKMKIVMFSLEMNQIALKEFVINMSGSYSEVEKDALERNFNMVPIGQPMALDRPEGQKFFESILDEYRPDGVIIDSMGKTTMEEIGEKKAKQLNAYYVRIKNNYNCFLFFVHHNRKANGDNKRPKELEDVYGSQYITAEASSVLVLWVDRDHPEKGIEVSNLKNRLAKQRSPFWVYRDENLYFHETSDAGQGLLNDTGNTDTTKPGEPGPDKPASGILEF